MLRTEIRKILRELRINVKSYKTFDEFIKLRQAWVPNGSTGGYYQNVDGIKVRLNKRAAMEQETFDHMRTWLSSTPKIVAHGSEKFEPGKGRPIYGTNIEEQTIAHYLITPIERAMSKHPSMIVGRRGLQEVGGILQRANIVSSPMLECTMLDYTDFNYQHTLEAMYILFDEIYLHLKALGAKSDVLKAAVWMRDAQLNQWVIFPGSPEPLRVTQGMFSGCRATGFINTMLNLAYFRVAVRNVAVHLDLRPVDLQNFHQGDDVWISNRSRLWAACLFRYMQDCGLEFNIYKQLFGLNVGEFLRVLYTPQGAHGYPMRAVATMLVRPVQSPEDLSPLNRATMITSQLNLLHRRGLKLDALQLIWTVMTKRATRFQVDAHWVTLPLSVLMKGTESGGINVGPPMSAPVASSLVPAPPSYRSGTTKLKTAVPANMSHDFITELSRKYPHPFQSGELETRCHDANLVGSMMLDEKRRDLQRHHRELEDWARVVRAMPVHSPESLARQHLDIGAMTLDPNMEKTYRDMLDSLFATANGFDVAEKNNFDAMMTCLHVNIFKGLSNIKIAFNVDVLDAVEIAFSFCEASSLKEDAYALYLRLKQVFSDDMLRYIFNEDFINITHYEAILHPVILSWVKSEAINAAICSSLCKPPTDIWEWQLRLDYWMTNLTNYFIVKGDLTKLSMY